ncbi:MAG: hypothetical protein HQK71_09020 [Desulfamplus sp.]|nr:hypothetical protein [Desulfamplus sp.]
MSEYTPPFKITPAVISLIVEISQVIERISIFEKAINNLRLRRINRVKTIKGSLAIEGNTLNESQITAILEGKWVIAPPEDGNGRMGRLWQTLILSKWNPLFATIPVESLVFENQEEYYRALSSSTTNAECSVFIEFMLRMICNAAKSLLEHLNTPEVNPEVTPEVKKMLYLLLKGDMSRKEIQLKLGLKDEKHFREAYIKPVSASGLIEMTIPDKPNSRLQKYRITPKGQAYLSIL